MIFVMGRSWQNMLSTILSFPRLFWQKKKNYYVQINAIFTIFNVGGGILGTIVRADMPGSKQLIVPCDLTSLKMVYNYEFFKALLELSRGENLSQPRHVVLIGHTIGCNSHNSYKSLHPSISDFHFLLLTATISHFPH